MMARHRAAFYGKIKIVKYLLKNTKQNLLQKDKRGNNCLHLAAMRINMSCIRFILKKLIQLKIGKIEDHESKQKLELLYLNKKNHATLSPLDYLTKAFNIIKEDESSHINDE